jgi:hypothetical protein
MCDLAQLGNISLIKRFVAGKVSGLGNHDVVGSADDRRESLDDALLNEV